MRLFSSFFVWVFLIIFFFDLQRLCLPNRTKGFNSELIYVKTVEHEDIQSRNTKITRNEICEREKAIKFN